MCDVSFSVEEGEIFGILGPNGACKTTTVECIEGLRSTDGGDISVLGLHPRADRTELRLVLGIQLQAAELPEKLRVREAVELFASFYETPADPGELIERWGLGLKRDTASGRSRAGSGSGSRSCSRSSATHASRSSTS